MSNVVFNHTSREVLEDISEMVVHTKNKQLILLIS